MERGSRSRLSRRAYLAAGSAALAGTAGCLEFLTGDELTFEATPSRVQQTVLDETGYEFAGHNENEVREEFDVGDETQEVVVTNVFADYEKTIDLGPIGETEGALFTALTSPQVSVLGQEFNPISDLSPSDLARMIQQQYDEVENLREEEQTEVTIQGEETTQTKFRADGAVEGSPVDLFVHVTEAVEMGDDFVVTVGVYPEVTPDEEDNILAMMEAVEHDE